MEVQFDDPTENINMVFDQYTVTIFYSLEESSIIHTDDTSQIHQIERQLKRDRVFLYKHQNLKYPDRYNFITRRFYREIGHRLLGN